MDLYEQGPYFGGALRLLKTERAAKLGANGSSYMFGRLVPIREKEEKLVGRVGGADDAWKGVKRGRRGSGDMCTDNSRYKDTVRTRDVMLIVKICLYREKITPCYIVGGPRGACIYAYIGYGYNECCLYSCNRRTDLHCLQQ